MCLYFISSSTIHSLQSSVEESSPYCMILKNIRVLKTNHFCLSMSEGSACDQRSNLGRQLLLVIKGPHWPSCGRFLGCLMVRNFANEFLVVW